MLTPWLSALSSVCLVPLLVSFSAPGPFSRWTALNVAFSPFIAFVSITLHELGHLAGARLMGLDVPRVQLSLGRPLGRVKLGKTLFVLHTLPVLGLTFITGARVTKLRYLVGVACGPLATCLLTWALWRVMSGDMNRFNGGIAVLEHAFIFNVWTQAFGLLPIGTGGYRTDGHLLLTIPFEPEFGKGANLTTELLEFSEAMERFDTANAERALERLRAKDATSFSFRLAEANLALLSNRFSDAAGLFEGLLIGLENEEQRALVENNLAWSYFCLRSEEHRARADELSARAIRAHPQQPWAWGTRGAVLVWLGSLEQAEGLLEGAYFYNSDAQNRAHDAACLALIALAKGDPASAPRWARRAPPHLTHLRAEVDAALAAVPPP